MAAKFVLKEKISDMIAYGYSTVKKFPNKERQLKEQLNNCMFSLLKSVIILESSKNKQRRINELEELDIQLDILRHLIRFAQDPVNYDNGKLPIPLAKSRYEHWSILITEIGKIIGGYKKYLPNPTDIEEISQDEIEIKKQEKLLRKEERQRNWRPKTDSSILKAPNNLQMPPIPGTN